MKQLKHSGIWKATNVTFDPSSCNAYSYVWWRFVARIEGKVLFNNYRYSVTTAKHQRKVADLLEQLGIKVDVTMPLPRGIRADQSYAEMVVEAEEQLCYNYLKEESKRIERNERAALRRAAAKLTDYLENSVAFRDYEIKPVKQFGSYNKVAVHQVVESKTLESDVQNALHSFHRDGFGSVVFYV